MIVVHIISVLVFIFMSLSIIYLFLFAAAGRFGKLRKYTEAEKKAMIAVLIPSYQDDSVIIDTAIQALNQSYPAEKYTVTVIADGLKPETLAQLKQLSITVVEVSFEVSMKAKSMNAAFKQLPLAIYDVAMILDSDNVMNTDCLDKVNHAFQQGWKVIQCHRTAKNKNTPIAILDALSEEVNNTIFRRGHRVAGFSCTLIGSGMAFKYDLLKEIFALPEIQNNPGEDREIDIQLVKAGITVEYIDDAYVFDEKVQRKEVFEKQRTRWLGTQIKQISRFFRKDMILMFWSKTYLNKCFQNFLLPRLLFVLLFFFIFILCMVDITTRYSFLLPSWHWWSVLFFIYLFTMLLAVPHSFLNRKTWNAFIHVPVLILSMMKALLRIGQNKKGFIHTPKEFKRP